MYAPLQKAKSRRLGQHYYRNCSIYLIDAIELGKLRSKKFKIHRGSLQGRYFSYPPNSRGFSYFTPAVLKEAVFELLLKRILGAGHRVEEYAFFDLSAGSGQMALEALSLGFQKAYISEIDLARVRHIKKELGYELAKNSPISGIKKAPLFSSLEIYCCDFRRMSSLISSHLQSVLYLDLPYSFWKGKKVLGVERFLLGLEKFLMEQGRRIWIFIQGPRFFETHKMKFVKNLELRRYGRQHLSFWLSCDDPRTALLTKEKGREETL